MNVGWQFGLYDAVIYIYNNGMLDYITPAEELLNILANAQQQVSLATSVTHISLLFHFTFYRPAKWVALCQPSRSTWETSCWCTSLAVWLEGLTLTVTCRRMQWPKSNTTSTHVSPLQGEPFDYNTLNSNIFEIEWLLVQASCGLEFTDIILMLFALMVSQNI